MTEKLNKYKKILINRVIYDIQFAITKHRLLIPVKYQ
jgi:hypothetical protein